MRHCVQTPSGPDCSQIVSRTGDPLTCATQLAEISEPAGDLNDATAEAGAADPDVTTPAAFPAGDSL